MSQQGRRGRPTPPKEPPPPARLAERVVYVSNICHMATARRRLSPQDRRAELLALGAEVFGKRPYDEVRIDEIAERAGVSRALMYHYFPDKRAFFAAVVKDEADRLYAATNKAPAPGMTMFEEIRTGVLAYMAYHQQNPRRRGPPTSASADRTRFCSVSTTKPRTARWNTSCPASPRS